METIGGIFTNSGAGYVTLRIVAIIILTFMAAKFYKAFFKKTVKSSKIHLKFIHNIIIMLIYVAGVLIALAQLPNMEAFKTLLAGSGIAALTIGLAAQESLGNAVNGMFISIFKPFEVGDRIHLITSNITGYIEDITLRHTVVRTFVNSRILIPNSVISKELIENSNYWDGKASSFIDVTVTYDSDLELAQKIISDIVTSHPDYVDIRPAGQRKGPADAKVFVRGLGLYGVDLRCSLWTDNIGNNFEACSDARKAIKLEFDRQGIKIAHSRNFDPGLTAQ